MDRSVTKRVRKLVTSGRKFTILIVPFAFLANCAATGDRALVYGERSGVNIALRTDPAKTRPIEVNAGVERRVTTLVPASSRDTNNRPTGEAVGLISTFDLDYSVPEGEQGLFAGRTKIASFIVTGAAAVKYGETVNGGQGSPDGLVEVAQSNREFVKSATK